MFGLGGHDAWPLPLHGACRCGRIRYQVATAPKFIFACHCTDCQQFTASAFSLGMAVDKTAFSVEGETHVWARTADSGKQSRKFTCPDCAGWTHTTTDSEPDLVVVRPITLAEHGWVRPIAQIFTGSALPWALLPTQFSFEKDFVDAAPLARAFAAGGIRPATA